MADSKKTPAFQPIHDGSPAAVAFNLMLVANAMEHSTSTEEKEKKREYWLQLYRECYAATTGKPA